MTSVRLGNCAAVGVLIILFLATAGAALASAGLAQVDAVVASCIAPSDVPFPSTLTVGGETGTWSPAPVEWLGDDGLPTPYAYVVVLVLRAALAAKDEEALEQPPPEPEGSHWIVASWPEALPGNLDRSTGALDFAEEFIAVAKAGDPCVGLLVKKPWGWSHCTTTMKAGWFVGTLDLIERASGRGGS